MHNNLESCLTVLDFTVLRDLMCDMVRIQCEKKLVTRLVGSCV